MKKPSATSSRTRRVILLTLLFAALMLILSVFLWFDFVQTKAIFLGIVHTSGPLSIFQKCTMVFFVFGCSVALSRFKSRHPKFYGIGEMCVATTLAWHTVSNDLQATDDGQANAIANIFLLIAAIAVFESGISRTFEDKFLQEREAEAAKKAKEAT